MTNEPLSKNRLVDGARLLPQVPVARQRQLQCEEEQRPVDAVMADHHDGPAGMGPEKLAQRRGCAGKQHRQRLTSGDRCEMGCAKPQLGLVRPARLRLVPGQPLPLAVIYVAEPVDGLRLQLKRGRDRRARVAATAEGAGVNRIRFPGRRDITRHGLGLPAAEIGEREIGATAKPLGRQPVDMSVPRQDDPGHSTASAQRAIASPISRPESSWMKWLPLTVTSV